MEIDACRALAKLLKSSSKHFNEMVEEIKIKTKRSIFSIFFHICQSDRSYNENRSHKKGKRPITEKLHNIFNGQGTSLEALHNAAVPNAGS